MNNVNKALVNLALYVLKHTKENAIMVTVYSTLIARGYKTICDVPTTIRSDVREELRMLELAHLADVECADGQ